MKLITDSDGVYQVTFTTQKGTVGSVSLETNDADVAAERVAQMHVQDLETVSSITDLTHQVVTQIVSGKDLTVGDTIDVWVTHAKASRLYSPTTIYANQGFLKAWARDMEIANKPLSSVTPAHVSDYVNRGDERRSSAVRKLSAIRTFFSYCQDEGLMYRNPAGKSLTRVAYEPFTHEEKEVIVRGTFTASELATLLEGTTGFWRCAILLSRETGLRLGDIANLEWNSFTSGRIVVWTDKANKRVDMPISSTIQSAIGALSDTGIRFCFPEQHAIISDPARRALLSIQFARLCAKVGIEGRSFHCLRHTNASSLVAAGSTLDEVAKRLGHSSTATTLGYVHTTG